MEKTRVLIVEDHRTVREGLRLMIERQPDIEVVGEAGTGDEALQMAQHLQVDLVVMDLALPEKSGLVASQALLASHPNVRIVMLTRYSEDAYFRAALRAGVSGYVLKQSSSEELLQAIRAVARGREYLDSALTAHVTRRLRGVSAAAVSASLSDREGEVLRHVAWGLSNKEIAAKLSLSVKTIEVHKSNAMKKLGMRSRIDVVRFALAQGWLQET